MSEIPDDAAAARQRFEEHYRRGAPWEIGAPQPAVVRLWNEGQITGRVLDIGCGTGDNARFLARQWLDVVAIDFLPEAIDRARRTAEAEGVSIDWRVGDALRLSDLAESFDTIIDSGLFHVFPGATRDKYVEGLAHVTRRGGRVHVLCFSDEEPGSEGPLRISQAELRAAFADGWAIQRIEPIQFAVAEGPWTAMFSPGGPRAWLATIVRQSG
jgi:SAM-dependent methyltransferase